VISTLALLVDIASQEALAAKSSTGWGRSVTSNIWLKALAGSRQNWDISAIFG
jgi:hypothetical protein